MAKEESMEFKAILKWVNLFFEISLMIAIFVVARNIFVGLLLCIMGGIRFYFTCKDEFLDAKSKEESESEMLSTSNDEKVMLENIKFLALQNQINPHFLYNTLEGIRSEALFGDRAIAAKMSELLASYFRYTISNVDKMVTVEDELGNIKNYFRIQKFRFDDRIEMNIELGEWIEEIKLCKIPKLILQPIIENAILHGLEPQLKKGVITIRFMLYETRLVIVVSDTGIGMLPEKVESLNEKMQEQSASILNTSIGIINVNRRLKMTFGADFGLRYFSKEGEGTDVEISIPFLKAGGNV